jgi:hypothetical protein
MQATEGSRFENQRAQNKEKYVEKYVEDDAQDLEDGELHGLILLAIPCEGDDYKRIKKKNERSIDDIFRMFAIMDMVGKERSGDNKQPGKGDGADQERDKGGAAHDGRLFLLVGEIEKARFHAIGINDIEKGDISIEDGNDAIVAGVGEEAGIEWSEEKVQQPGCDISKSVKNGMISEFAQGQDNGNYYVMGG